MSTRRLKRSVVGAVTISRLADASGLVTASVGGVFLGVFVALSSLAYCASLLALSLRPVMQNLTPMVAKRLQATETLEYESEYEARGDGGGKGLLEDLEY